ncbi:MULTISPECIES: glucose-6-phosphate dehydrogenase [unclassified Rathayibacter]|uniref:glucose-6-phosphate dehydrogenase n=1 Tax=unclassified Rathayibacter TaxID=2609250 RepID=UPI000F4B021D|nr:MULTISPECIES: glucose-6-phosphate dehydrogenase [unclassified Rathayibacter]MCJ1674192.1 glucose-6-phosphate dehydrogenase [Rathayibacter sp. VKM Ac-2929]MCJ1684473.1 glucose-6-phosphate dehydrogenase [Rathayibacter sp. VKM Ac-2928]MCJ1689510.1 glucose-6-phosphate dehydrogenase [Rathayibacter sp. VKM Ac-2927]MCJ1705227.1 glucose-6-phosphate dehydrogenase [Rathayibacter sp. VKM Ac-2926]ROP50484.1 glucose-6-phosphate 1-dehydrogenase [Rathayibacter sp. PhB186]
MTPAPPAPAVQTEQAAPHVVVLFGAVGDLSRRKLIPGMAHLALSSLAPDLQIVGTSLEEHDDESFRAFAKLAYDEFGSRSLTPAQWDEFASKLRYVPQSAGPAALAKAVTDAEKVLGPDVSRLHYLSVPPRAALSVVRMLAEAGLVERSRIIMEKPFGVDLESAVVLNAELHETFDEEQIFRIDHFLGKEPAQNILAFRFANGLFEPIWNRNFIDHVQIDIPEKLTLDRRAEFYESTGAYKDMVVTHLFQVLAFMAMEPPTALEPKAISEEKNKVFRSMRLLNPENVVRGQYIGYREEPGVAPDSETDTFVALKCEIDNWRWAGVPFYLRTGKRMAEGQRIISIAFREPPKSMFPQGSGVGAHGPDHLTFDLADASKVSLSFYGKRPGPGMRLDKLSMQFALQETDRAGDALEAYERLILDAMRGDHTLFTTAEGIERLWEVSAPLLQDPPPVRLYAPGSWGPNAIHQLIAPHAWRLPFERVWRDKR